MVATLAARPARGPGLTIRDESAAGAVLDEWRLDDWAFDPPTETMTVRALIRERVYQEVKDQNAGRARRGPALVTPLVTPAAAETALNGPPKPRPAVDWKRQFELACEAFDAGRVLVLVGDEQADSLDATFPVATTTAVTFLKLTPLVGG